LVARQPTGPPSACSRPSKPRSIKVAASPRNQRYLQPPPNPAGVVVCQGENPSQRAEQLDLKLALGRQQADLFDQAAQRCGGSLAT
jgi:hypothetical protein